MTASSEEIAQIERAIACNDVSRVDELLTSHAALRQFVRDDPCIMPTQAGRTPMMELRT